MKLLSNLSLLILLVALIAACSTEPEPINYGQDQCVFCKMNIVDKAHSAQYVSSKGKQFKYDAIECLIRDVVRNNIADIEHILVADYSDPGSMIDANSASYIISENIKSPMGANLSAVAEETDAREIISANGGEMYIWESIKPRIATKK